tara:strand:- start:726 stop:932 length:207 start_codon:yes stop_codon:yes gene_type:complete
MVMAKEITQEEKDIIIKSLLTTKTFCVEFHMNDKVDKINQLLDMFFDSTNIHFVDRQDKVMDCNIPVT